jgi:tetratricopeptide (TPR) repeat protein
MANELTNYSGYYTVGTALDLQGQSYRQFMERQTRDTGAAIQSASDQQTQAIREQSRGERENAMAIVASNAAIARINERGFEQQHGDALMLNNTLEAGFSGLANQLGTMTASFNAGFDRVTGSIARMSADICGRLDAINDTLKNPLRTLARELYNRASVRYTRGLFEEALKDVKAAVEKDETDYLSWFLMGNVYLFGAGEFSNVIDLDQAIAALSNAAKYISPDVMPQEARTKKIRLALEPGLKDLNADNFKNYDSFSFQKGISESSGVDWAEAGSIWNACKGDKEEIFRRLIGCNVSDRLAAEIYFYLGLAKYYKSNDLTIGKEEAEAKSVLQSALQTFTRSLDYSDRMLESRYDSARCKALLGDTEGAIKDLEEAIKGDRNYSLKVLADSDFDGISKDVNVLIVRLKNEAYYRAKPVFDKLRSRLDDTLFLDGEFAAKVKKTSEERVPQTFGEDLPYFDIRDGDEWFPVIFDWLNKGDPGIKSRSRTLEEEERRNAALRQEVEEQRRANEQKAARDAKELARYKRQKAIWVVLRIIFALAFAGLGSYLGYIYYMSQFESGRGDPGFGSFFLLLVIAGCTLGGIFSVGAWIVGLIAGVIMGVGLAVTGSGVGVGIFGAIISAIVLGGVGFVSGLVTEFFYQIVKKLLGAELKFDSDK